MICVNALQIESYFCLFFLQLFVSANLHKYSRYYAMQKKRCVKITKEENEDKSVIYLKQCDMKHLCADLSPLFL